MTYATLKTDVDSWLARDDVAVSGVSIDSITRMAEAWLWRECYPMGFQRLTTLSVTARSIAAPSGFKSLMAMYFDAQQDNPITYMTPEVIRRTSEWAAGGTSPVYYTIEAINDVGTVGFTFAPAGSVSAPLTVYLQYHGDLPSIIDAPYSNALLERGYDVYLSAMCAAGARWAQMFELADGWDQRTYACVASFNKAEGRRRFSGNALVANGSPRTVV